MDELKLNWLAGILEGEGSFGSRKTDGLPRIALEMTDLDVVEEVARLVGSPKVQRPKPRNGWRQVYRIDLSGRRAAEVMARVAPLMHSRRRARIEKALELYRSRQERRQH